MSERKAKKRVGVRDILAVNIASPLGRWTRYDFQAICVCFAILVAQFGCGPSADEVWIQECYAKGATFREHINSAEFTVEEANRLSEVVAECDSATHSKIIEIAESEPNEKTYNGRLAMLVAYRSSVKAGIVCDRFELKWELDGADLLLAIDTDLPDEAKISVSVGRTYFQVGNDSAYSSDYFHESEDVLEWRKPRRIPLNAKAWKESLSTLQNMMAGQGNDSAFEIESIDGDVNIHAVLIVIDQDDPRFGGDGNPNLSGNAVEIEMQTVIAEASFSFPLAGPPPARRSKRVAYDELIVGNSYRLSRDTPIMPGYTLEMAAGTGRKMRTAASGTILTILAIERQDSYLWYQVMDDVGEGWVNSDALIGQEIEGKQ